ncbi:hypothetical protein Gotri_007309 [Gossypium trilobum]|uniref:Uncharacterized protein n=1 Tax=Gossypium trilobum TaxID=34281 RepID=A0A7J9EFN6_9ROSI|nr:hypothetical protein [Gossypium trilobum]
MSEDTNGSFLSGSQKVRRREEDPPDNRGGSEQTEPMGSKPFSFRDAVMNSNPLNNPLNNKWDDDNIDLMDDLSGSLYKRSIFEVISEMVGNIIKIDLMTDKGARGQFSGFAVQIDLRKSFISKIKIASRIHRVEYESLPMVFIGCGTFRHLKRDYPQPKIMENMEKRLGEAEDPIRLDQHENTRSIQEQIENEKFGDGENIDGLVGMVPVRQTIQGMVDSLEVEGGAANT